MKYLLLAIGLLALAAPLQARDFEPRWRAFATRDVPRDYADHDGREERFAERRERMRALREEMQRSQPRPQPYRDDEARRMPPERREFIRQPLPPSSREADGAREGLRRLSPEERRELRRQLRDAGRDVYHGQ